MQIILFNNLEEKDKSEAIKNLMTDSTPRQEFFLMIILSVLMATFGILINNITVVIGSMLIAPILYPIMSLALGVVMASREIIRRSIFTILKSIAMGLTASALVTLFADPLGGNYSSALISAAQPSLAYAAIAIIAGLAASFAIIKTHLNESLTGIAISVALIPPLAVCGIGIARLDWTVITAASSLFLINLAGIMFAGVIVFSLMNLSIKRRVADKAIKEEEKEIQKETKLAEKQMDKK
ncbi:MAG: TIGR00341 family protein [bacterium]